MAAPHMPSPSTRTPVVAGATPMTSSTSTFPDPRRRPRAVLCRSRLTVLTLCAALGLGCGSSDGSGDSGPGTDGGGRDDAMTASDGSSGDARPAGDGGGLRDAARGDAGSPPPMVGDRARALALHLRSRSDFLIGMGNDLDGAPTYDPDRAGAFTLGTGLDLHYMYLVGYSDMGGWPTWNSGGTFVTIQADAAARHDTVPMFTYYQLALDYETGGDPLRDGARMRVWLSDVRLLFQRLGETGRPAIVHFEPDLFGYLQERMRTMGTTPEAYSARLHHAEVPECAAVPETAAGLGDCLLALRDALAPMTRIGLAASQWADWYDATDPSAGVEGKARSVARFLASMGAARMDLIVVETLDRDAGFWETYGGSGAMCSVTDGPRGPVYWDETNATVPSFQQHLRWVRALTEGLGVPALWWQTPFGVPSDACGGTDGHYRDNRVRYFFSHVDDLVAAGGVGAVFGTGAGRQTYITTDGGQFGDAVAAYFASPLPI